MVEAACKTQQTLLPAPALQNLPGTRVPQSSGLVLPPRSRLWIVFQPGTRGVLAPFPVAEGRRHARLLSPPIPLVVGQLARFPLKRKLVTMVAAL